MNVFKIGEDDFGIGKVSLEVDYDNSLIIDLTLEADENTYETISSDAKNGWDWTLYPPRLYFYEVPFIINDMGNVEVNFNDDLLGKSDFALYFMEHNYIRGKLVVNAGSIQIKGETSIMGKKYLLEVFTNEI
jgi:hypothetical protein